MSTVDAEFGRPPSFIPEFKLIICDAPYGGITKEKWDVAHYFKWWHHCVRVAAPDATIVMFGGVGKKGHRPFLEFVSQVEIESPSWEGEFVTWKKRRGFGKQRNYLFTREELFILKRGEPPFHIPLLDEKRGYPGFNKKYPAKSEFLRRSNVWSDITEIFRGKIHPTQKPDKLYEVIVETHSDPGDVVYDPCAGSGTTARAALKTGRRYCIVEKKRNYLKLAGLLP
jgi:DNA modification methylase